MSSGLSIALPSRAVHSGLPASSGHAKPSEAEEWLLSLFHTIDQAEQEKRRPSLPSLPALPAALQRPSMASPLRISGETSSPARLRASSSTPTGAAKPASVVKATQLSDEMKKKLQQQLQLQQAKDGEDNQISPMKRPLPRSSSPSLAPTTTSTSSSLITAPSSSLPTYPPPEPKRHCPTGPSDHASEPSYTPAFTASLPSSLPTLPTAENADSAASNSTSLFVGDLPENYDIGRIKMVLSEKFSPFGYIQNIHIVPFKNFGFVRFGSAEHADAALQALNGSAFFEGYPPHRMRKAHPPRSDSHRS